MRKSGKETGTEREKKRGKERGGEEDRDRLGKVCMCMCVCKGGADKRLHKTKLNIRLKRENCWI